MRDLSLQVLKALAHPVRLRIMNALREDEECVCHLTAYLRQRQAYVSQQLMFLRRAGLLQDRKEGLRVYYRIKDPRILHVLDAVNALTNGKAERTARQVIATCSCPKCETQRRQTGGRKWKSKSSVPVAPTA